MEELGISWTAILVATVANFIVGFLWYTPLFGKVWAKEMGMSPDGKPTSGQMTRGLVLGFIGNFLLAYVFAHNNAAWTFVPGMDQFGAGATIAQAAIFTWLGFYVPADLNTVAWEGKSWKLFFINTGYHLTILLVAATILVLMS
jgi:hypothetical protein